MDITLQEIMNHLNDFVQQFKTELDRITRELAKLENMRGDQYERLSREGNDVHLRKQLDETDEKINHLKRKRQAIQTEATQQIREYRLGAEKYRDEKIRELKSLYEKFAEERDALRDEVIPELEQEIRDLSGKKKNLDSQILTITSEINVLDRFTIEVPEME
jgi:type I site-specific restriction endonuclease